MKKKYSCFANHSEENSYTVIHTNEDDESETIICITDTSEKADFITKACNSFEA